MHCRLLRQRLSDPARIDTPDMLAHIAECAGCRTAWEAERLLRKGLRPLHDQRPLTVEFGRARQWVNRMGDDGRNRRNLPSVFRLQFMTGNRWGWSVVLAVAVLMFMILIPMSYEFRAGTQLSITSNNPALASVDFELLNARLAERNLSRVNFQYSTGPDGHVLNYYVSGSQTDALTAFEQTRDLLPLLGASAHVEVHPWVVKESGSLLAQIGIRVFEVNVKTSGLSDAQIAAEVERQLIAQGMTMDNVWIERTDSMTTMQMDGHVAGDGIEQEFHTEELFIGREMNNVDHQLFIEDFPDGMTDAQIRDEIQRRLADRRITDSDVTVKNGEIKVNAFKFKSDST